MKKIYLSLLIVLSLTSCAQQKNTTKTAAKGNNIVDYQHFNKIRTNKPEGKITTVEGAGENAVLRIETFKQPDFIYKLATAIPIKKQDYQKGRVFLLSFDAKTEHSGFETGEAKVLWQLRQSKTHSKNISKTISLASEWKTYYIPFELTENTPKDILRLVMQFGFRPQSFLIKNIKFESFPTGTKLADLPKTKITYQGIEKDAKWRKDAFKRIDKYRKGDFTLTFTKNNKPVANSKVHIKLVKHQFPFGAAIRTKEIVNHTLVYKKFKETFDLVVLENGLKIRMWQFEKKRAQTLKALDILQKDKKTVKGHVLIWPGFKYLSKEINLHKNNPAKVKDLMLGHVAEILKATKGKVSQWDVVNEVYTNKDLQKLTGSEDILYEGFRLVKKIQPESLRFTNEYGILSNGGIDTKKQQWYFDFIKRIDKNTGGLVDGIGIQSHIGSDLTPPEKVVEILDFYAKLDKDICISEFTMDVEDPEIRTQYTRDFIIAAFSHPKVSQFIFWGLMDNKFKKVNIFNKDGSVGAMGKAYFDLMQNELNTDLTLKTDSHGTISGNGFFGKYEYIVKVNGKEIKGYFNFKNLNNNNLTIDLK